MLAIGRVTLSLNGTTIANNSYVDVRDIGDTDDNALHCQTDKMNCCESPPNRAGEWYYPNVTTVKNHDDSMAASPNNYFYRNRGQSVVRLKRVENPSQRGLFWCEVPTLNNENETIFVNIGMSNKQFIIVITIIYINFS